MNFEFFGGLLRQFEIPADLVLVVGAMAGFALAMLGGSVVFARRQLVRRRLRKLRNEEGRRRVHLYQADARREPYLGTDPQGSVPRERRAASGG